MSRLPIHRPPSVALSPALTLPPRRLADAATPRGRGCPARGASGGGRGQGGSWVSPPHPPHTLEHDLQALSKMFAPFSRDHPIAPARGHAEPRWGAHVP